MMQASLSKEPPSAHAPNRWWVYQRERFPVLAHGVLIAAFSFSAVSFSALLRGGQARPGVAAAVAAFITSFLFFLQLRISDEFKDCEEDARWRPYRPVPRGLVSLRELKLIGWCAAVMQLACALWLTVKLVPLLLLAWSYLALMSREFFVRAWITARPVTYLWTHMLMLPLIDLYATACDWLPGGGRMPGGLYWFLAVSFCNGVVVELGRKLRAPEDEEPGVQTYTALWGQRRAPLVWLGAMIMTALLAFAAAAQINFARPVALLLSALLVAAGIVVSRFLRRPVAARAKWFELMSGIWTLLMYLWLGAIPLLAGRGGAR